MKSKKQTFFNAKINGSLFDKNGATRGVCDNRSNHDFMYEGLTAKLLFSAKI